MEGTISKELQEHIKPSEFTFCGRCGDNCRIGGKNFMCTSCKSSLFSKKETQEEKRERMLKETAEKSISHIIKGYRKDLAELRKKGV